MKKKIKLSLNLWVSFFIGVTFAYFVWLTWNKLTEVIGNSNIVWMITGTIVVIGLITGYLSVKKIVGGFT